MDFVTVNFFILSCLAIFGKLVFAAWSTTHELNARNAVFNSASYHKMVRPSEKTNVNVSLNLFSINDLSLSSQQLSMTGWLSMEWDDSRLVWSTATHETDYIFALDSEIWKPEIFIDNSIADVSILSDEELAFRVKNDGKVSWELPRIFNTHCDIDVTYYPFDSQTCSIEVVSWSLTVDELVMTNSRTEVNVEDLKENGEWVYSSSTSVASELEETRPDGTKEKFSLLTFTIKLQRRTTYYGKSLLLPVIMTSFLVLLVFVLPVSSGEKVGFSLTVLLALAVLLTIITDSIPRTSINLSVLSTYLATTLGLSVFTCSATVTVISIYHRDLNKKIPNSVRMLVRFMARASCYTGCCCRKKEATADGEKSDDVVREYTKSEDNFIEKSIFEDDDSLTWHEVAKILDWFLFVYMLIINSLSTFIFMLTLSIGGATKA